MAQGTEKASDGPGCDKIKTKGWLKHHTGGCTDTWCLDNFNDIWMITCSIHPQVRYQGGCSQQTAEEQRKWKHQRRLCCTQREREREGKTHHWVAHTLTHWNYQHHPRRSARSRSVLSSSGWSMFAFLFPAIVFAQMLLFRLHFLRL